MAIFNVPSMIEYMCSNIGWKVQ